MTRAILCAPVRPVSMGRRSCHPGPLGKFSFFSGVCAAMLAIGFPDAGLQSSVPKSALNVQFMVKDSKGYAATGGWGFADFTNGKPGNEALHKTCFGCHQPAKDHDYIFTRCAPTP